MHICLASFEWLNLIGDISFAHRLNGPYIVQISCLIAVAEYWLAEKSA